MCFKYYYEGRCNNVTVETPWGCKKLRCNTCVTIKGVIQALRLLVFREPYLLTEGLAGAPKKEAWEEGGGEEEKKEVEEVEEVEDDDDSDGEDPDGFSKEERARVRAEAEASVMKRWGLLRAEQSAEEEPEREGEEQEGKEKELAEE